MLKKIISCFVSAALMAMPCASLVNASGELKLQYKMGGTDYEYYLPESYYTVPVVKDLDKDGRNEIIAGNYGLSVLDAETGSIIWRINGGKDRSSEHVTHDDVGILHEVAVNDIDADGYDEIVCIHANGIVSVLSWNGYMKEGWPQQLWGAQGKVTAAARSLEVSDLNGDGQYEIIVGAAANSSESVWVYDARGNIMEGWPQLSYEQNGLNFPKDIKTGYAYGVFMDGVTSGDIDGDGMKEILVANDTGYLCAYDMDGKLVPANEKLFGGRTWGKIALWEDEAIETNRYHNTGWYYNEGWGPGNDELSGSEPRSELYKGEMAHGVVRVCDIDNNGENEVVASTIILDRYHDRNMSTGDYASSKYMTFFVFNGDRTRFEGWSESPSDKNFMGAPLIQNSANLSSWVQAEPVICDLNCDGVNEILINTYDGCVHAFSVDNANSEYAGFPFRIPQPAGIAETASGVVCKDIDGNGQKEVIFATYTDTPAHDMSHNVKGNIYILNSDGSLRSVTELVDGYLVYETKKPAFTNTVLAKPVVEDIDNDGLFEIVLNTRYAGICVYEIAGTTTQLKATPTSATLLVNGEKVSADSYSINGNNYYKLRDLAMMVNGTAKQFGIGYDAKTGAVEIIPGEAYEPVGGELAQGDGKVKYVKESTSSILNGSALATFIPYKINGNNYFKLRDICRITGMTVDWDGETSTITLSSN